MQKRFKVLAVNDDRSECECCGKQGLKKVVWIEDTETNITRHFGVVCALSPVKGFDVKAEVQKATRSFEADLENMLRMTFREYRKQGGKMVSNGVPLAEGGALVYENQALFDQIFHRLKQPKLEAA